MICKIDDNLYGNWDLVLQRWITVQVLDSVDFELSGRKKSHGIAIDTGLG